MTPIANDELRRLAGAARYDQQNPRRGINAICGPRRPVSPKRAIRLEQVGSFRFLLSTRKDPSMQRSPHEGNPHPARIAQCKRNFIG